MSFHKIDLAAWARKTHYEAYTTALPLNWNLTVELDISRLLPAVRARGLRFYPVMLYIAARAVNANQAFCMGLDADGALGYYDEVHPSYTIFHPDDQTFSDLWSFYHPEFPRFYRDTVRDMETYQNVKGYKVRPDQPENCFPASMTPWLPFTSCSFDTFRPAKMLQPILTFGQYTERDGQWRMPAALCASHAVADGWHAACLFRQMQALCDSPADFWTLS